MRYESVQGEEHGGQQAPPVDATPALYASFRSVVPKKRGAYELHPL